MLLHFIPGFITSDSTGSVLPAVWSSSNVSTGVLRTARQYLFVFLSKCLYLVFTFGFCSMKRQGVGCVFSNSSIVSSCPPLSGLSGARDWKARCFWGAKDTVPIEDPVSSISRFLLAVNYKLKYMYTTYSRTRRVNPGQRCHQFHFFVFYVHRVNSFGVTVR